MNWVIRPAELRPVAQIAKDSYLGAALRNVESHKKRKRHRPLSPQSSDPDLASSDSETSPSGSSPDSNSWNLSQSEDAQHHRHRGNKHGRNRPCHCVSSRSYNSSRPNIKPIPPLEYDGKADACAYHRFVRKSEAYLRDGRVCADDARCFCCCTTLLDEPMTSILRRYPTMKINGTYESFTMNSLIIVSQWIIECK